MDLIKTASTTERIVRNGIFTIIVVVFALWSLYDGYIRYPQQNLEQARQGLPSEQQDQAQINKKVRKANVVLVQRGQEIAKVEAEFGLPAWRGRDQESFLNAAWFGPGGVMVVQYNNLGIVTAPAVWKPGRHSESDLLVQKIMGFVLLPIGLLLLIRWIAMFIWGAELTEEGLKPSGKPLIPYQAMTGWDTSDYREKGRIRLTYELDGVQGTYVLDDYKLKAFPAIVGTICDRRGFENPIRRQETEAAGTAEE